MTVAAVATPTPAEPVDPTPAVPTPAVPATPATPAVAAVPPTPAVPAVPPAPVVPETYTLTLPENGPLTADDLGVITAEAKALGLTQAQAETLVTSRATTLTTIRTQFLSDAKADPEIGGAHFDETVRHATAGRDWLFPPGTEEATLITGWFNQTGLGNHKAFLRAMAKIGKARQEDSAVGSRSTAPAAATKSPADVLYGTTPAS